MLATLSCRGFHNKGAKSADPFAKIMGAIVPLCITLSGHAVGVTGAIPEGRGARRQPYGVPKDRRIGMIRWLLLAAVVFLVIAALQSFLASRRGKQQLEGTEVLPNPPPLTDATEVEHSRRELEELEQRLNIRDAGRQGKGA